jgi:hypothetical protein
MSFKSLICAVLRAGLSALGNKPTPSPYRGRVFRMANPKGIDLDKALGIAAEIENDEIARKLALRK